MALLAERGDDIAPAALVIFLIAFSRAFTSPERRLRFFVLLHEFSVMFTGAFPAEEAVEKFRCRVFE
ncbi:MAG: hypothetical protein MZV70_02745 [Desulfobacterales bacterium]|nr:hypothetical protein [Desulfobacterales bacterium]